MLNLKDFDYPLPEKRIALYPLEDRPSAKMLIADRKTESTQHKNFYDLPSILNSNDLLIFNNVKVIPARLFGVKETGGKAEFLLLKRISDKKWEALAKPSGKIKKGSIITISDQEPQLKIKVLDDPQLDSGKRLLELECDDVFKALEMHGHIPLPPYIDRADEEIDKSEYQTVFADKPGAIAAPTAGLHFSDELMQKLREKGIQIEYTTLYVGYGTFQPIQTEDITQHEMFEEEYEVSDKTAEAINRAKKEGRRVIVCGTTCVRALESSANAEGVVSPGRGKTSLFIHPPYQFKVVDSLITNFHFPKSTLLVLVSTLMGYDFMREAYQQALDHDYRFASYGDGMIIL